MSTRTSEFAERLIAARTDRVAISPLTDEAPDFGLADGYAVQRLLRDAAGPLSGWKLGITSRAKQLQVNLSEPVYGFLPAADALDAGQSLVVAEHIQPRVEPEIVFVMGSAVSGPHATAADVLAATSAIAVGLEVLDSRYQDYRFTSADVVADDTSFGRYLVGPSVSPSGVDLRLVGVVLEHNGAVVSTAAGAASLGHPAAAVAWLVRTLAVTGEGLRAGDVVLSGGLTAAVPVRSGDTVVATIDRLGSVELPCV